MTIPTPDLRLRRFHVGHDISSGRGETMCLTCSQMLYSGQENELADLRYQLSERDARLASLTQSDPTPTPECDTSVDAIFEASGGVASDVVSGTVARNLERRLAMAEDAANKGDHARSIAGAQEQEIADLRSKLEKLAHEHSDALHFLQEKDTLIADLGARLSAAEQRFNEAVTYLAQSWAKDDDAIKALAETVGIQGDSTDGQFRSRVTVVEEIVAKLRAAEQRAGEAADLYMDTKNWLERVLSDLAATRQQLAQAQAQCVERVTGAASESAPPASAEKLLNWLLHPSNLRMRVTDEMDGDRVLDRKDIEDAMMEPGSEP